MINLNKNYLDTYSCMFMNISAEAHCWVVTGISYSLFHLVTVIYDLLNEDVMRPNQLFLLSSDLFSLPREL